MSEMEAKLLTEAKVALAEYRAAVVDEELAKTYAHSAHLAAAEAYRKKEDAMKALETLWEQVP